MVSGEGVGGSLAMHKRMTNNEWIRGNLNEVMCMDWFRDKIVMEVESITRSR